MARALTSGDVAKAMGTTRQVVNKWLRSGMPKRLDRRGGGAAWNPAGRCSPVLRQARLHGDRAGQVSDLRASSRRARSTTSWSWW